MSERQVDAAWRDLLCLQDPEAWAQEIVRAFERTGLKPAQIDRDGRYSRSGCALMALSVDRGMHSGYYGVLHRSEFFRGIELGWEDWAPGSGRESSPAMLTGIRAGQRARELMEVGHE